MRTHFDRVDVTRNWNKNPRAICDLSEPETARPIVRDELFMNVLRLLLRCYNSDPVLQYKYRQVLDTTENCLKSLETNRFAHSIVGRWTHTDRLVSSASSSAAFGQSCCGLFAERSSERASLPACIHLYSRGQTIARGNIVYILQFIYMYIRQVRSDDARERKITGDWRERGREDTRAKLLRSLELSYT